MKMPSLLAASMMVLPSVTSICLPSISISSISWYQALFVFNVMLELVAEMGNEAFNRQRGGVAQSANGASRDVVRDIEQQIQILLLSLAVLDAVHHPVQPAGAFAARRALAAGFLEVKIGKPKQRFHHARRFIHNDDCAGTQHRARLGD